MRIYVSVSSTKSQGLLYQAYKETVEHRLEKANNLYQADVALLLGGWDYKLSRTAHKAKRIGVPYVIVPLGDLSPWNLKHPLSRWWLKKGCYQKTLVRDAACLIATTPMEKEQLLKLGWQGDVRLVRYPVYTKMATAQTMAEGIDIICRSALAEHERRLQAQIVDMSDDLICRQLLTIYARIPHRDIPREAIDKLHQLLMADNYDEDLLAKEIGQLRLTSFSASLFQSMRDITQLTEGFMPLPPKEGKLAKRISQYVRD